MCSAGRNVCRTHRYDIPRHSMDALSCIPLSVLFAITSHGGKPTVGSYQISVLPILNTAACQRKAHINNLYNTVFWALIQKGGQTTTEAHATLRVCFLFICSYRAPLTYNQGTVSSTKHEMLFSRFGINYNEISDRFKKGSVIVREMVRLISLDAISIPAHDNV